MKSMKEGFSLVEVIVAIAVLALLSCRSWLTFQTHRYLLPEESIPRRPQRQDRQ